MNKTKKVDQTTPKSGPCSSLKKRFHITYFLHRLPHPLVSGETILADNIVKAVSIFLLKNTDVNINDIKYAIEL